MRVREPAHRQASFGLDAEIVRESDFRARGAITFQAFLEQSERRFGFALEEQSGGAENCSGGVPEGKALLARDPDLFLSDCLRGSAVPAELIKPGGVIERVGEAERIVELPGERHRVLAKLQRAIRIAEMPQRKREVRAGADAEVFTGQLGQFGCAGTVIVLRN